MFIFGLAKPSEIPLTRERDCQAWCFGDLCFASANAVGIPGGPSSPTQGSAQPASAPIGVEPGALRPSAHRRWRPPRLGLAEPGYATLLRGCRSTRVGAYRSSPSRPVSGPTEGGSAGQRKQERGGNPR